MNGTHNDYHDSDIADLVDDNTNGNGGAGKTAILEMTPLNNSSNDSNSGRGSSNAARSGLEEAGLFKQPSRGGSSPPPPLSYGDFQLNCCSPLGTLLFVYICYTCEYAPRTCWTIGIVVLLISSYLLIVGVLANPTEHFGVIQHDFSNIQSQYDFHIKDIDHWCLQGDNDSCQCQDPLQPTPRNDLRIWTNTHGGNVETVNKMVENGMGSPDIAFLGGTIVEAMDGKWFGNRDNPRLMDIGKIFDSYFISNVDDDDDEDDDDDDASTDEDKLTAVSLGIAGDTNPSVLWRILHGEMPEDFNPKIWWLELGLNDLGHTQCSEEVVVLGVLRVVEEILQQKPDAKIVINSLFPMAQLRQNDDLESNLGPRNNKLPKGGVARKKPPNGVTLPNQNGVSPPEGVRGSPMPPPPTTTVHNKNNNQNNMIQRPIVDDTDDGNPRGLKRRILRDRDRPMRGPIKLNDHKTSQHKFNVLTHRQKELPLWTSIVAVNKELQRFCGKHDRVTFHDVTKIFTVKGGEFSTLNIDLINAKGLPTEQGFDAWETSIVTRAQFLLREDSR